MLNTFQIVKYYRGKVSVPVAVRGKTVRMFAVKNDLLRVLENDPMCLEIDPGNSDEAVLSLKVPTAEIIAAVAEAKPEIKAGKSKGK